VNRQWPFSSASSLLSSSFVRLESGLPSSRPALF
jgi:hypothetical protein